LKEVVDCVAPRQQWSSAAGKLQFTAKVVRGMQAELSEVYKPVYDVVAEPGCRPLYADWSPSARISVGEPHLRALQNARKLYGPEHSCSRPFYYSDNTDTSAFWTGEVVDSHEFMDEHSATAEGIPVFTGDASGFAAGVWYRDLRHIHYFPPHLQAPEVSSNYRELYTALLGLEKWGSLWEKLRLLYRSDNSTTVSIINKGGTTAAALLPLIKEIDRLCALHKIDLAACHIPGVINVRADDLSRFTREKDFGDWRILDQVFHELHAATRAKWMDGRSWTLDGSADVNGNNAMLPRYCSKLDSILDRDLRGERLWCNPDFDLIKPVLAHFRNAYRSAPDTTSGTFVIPEWTNYPYWGLLKGARVVARYPRGTPLFTSPDWGALRLPAGGHSFGKERSFRGNTRWPVIVVHFPCAGAHRSFGGGPQADPVHDAGSPGQRHVRILQGEPARDEEMLRLLPTGVL
jgi:hypothetical protein